MDDFLNFEKPYKELMRILEEDNEENIKVKLKQITQKESLDEIELLKVRINSGNSLVRRGSRWLPSLKILNLTGSNFGSLRELGTDLKALEILIINNCGLDSLDGLENFHNLKVLKASDNSISDLFQCILLDKLNTLIVQRNEISTIEDIGYLIFCTQLLFANLLDNPVCEVLQSLNKNDEVHKCIIRELLPKLQYTENFPTGNFSHIQKVHINSDLKSEKSLNVINVKNDKKSYTKEKFKSLDYANSADKHLRSLIKM